MGRARGEEVIAVKFEIKPSGSQWFFRILSSNGNVLAHSETYWNRSDCENAARLIKNQAYGAPIV